MGACYLVEKEVQFLIKKKDRFLENNIRYKYLDG